MYFEAQKEGKSESELDEMWWKRAGEIVSGYYKTRAEVEKEVEGLKKFFRSQKEMPGKTKADIVKQIWAELPKHMDTPVAPLDEEMPGFAEVSRLKHVEPMFLFSHGKIHQNWRSYTGSVYVFPVEHPLIILGIHQSTGDLWILLASYGLTYGPLWTPSGSGCWWTWPRSPPSLRASSSTAGALCLGFHSHRDTPIAGWFLLWKILLK